MAALTITGEGCFALALYLRILLYSSLVGWFCALCLSLKDFLERGNGNRQALNVDFLFAARRMYEYYSFMQFP